jgi:glutaredoxin
VSGLPERTVRLTLLTRSGCSLCVAARETVARVAAEEDVAWTEQDIASDDALSDAYGDRIPVLLLDGQEHAYWRVEERRLRDALHGRRSW